MTIRWNGFDRGLAPGVAPAMDDTLGPLPTVYEARSGLRTNTEQAGLFAQGRNAQGVVINRALIVTNARPGQSAHNWGMAVDFVPLVSGVPLWEPVTRPEWTAMIAAVRANPLLKTGADITLASGDRDWGHVEVNNWRAKIPMTVPAEATDLSTPSVGEGAIPASDTPQDVAVGSPPTDGSTSWFELDPGVAVGAAAVVGLLLLLYLRRRRARA